MLNNIKSLINLTFSNYFKDIYLGCKSGKHKFHLQYTVKFG